jgi:hypothetical protein
VSNDDITRNYHGGNPQSEQANKRTRKTVDRARVYQFVWSNNLYGATCYETEQATGMRHQTCSARFSDLKKDGIIIGTGRTRLTDTQSPAEVCVATIHIKEANEYTIHIKEAHE